MLEISKIRLLVNTGKRNEALVELSNCAENFSFDSEEYLECTLEIVKIIIRNGEPRAAKEKIMSILSNSSIKLNNRWITQFKIELLKILFQTGKIEASIQLIIELNDRVMKLQQPSQDYYKTRLLNYTGNIKWLTGKFDQALGFYYGALKIIKKNNFDYEKPNTINNIGFILLKQNKLEKAQTQFEEAIYLSKKHTDTEQHIRALDNLTLLFLAKGLIDHAIECNKKGYTIVSHDGNDFELSMNHHNRGMIDEIRGELESAMKNFEQAVPLLQKLGNEIYLSRTLYYLILCSLDLGLTTNSEKWLLELKIIHEKNVVPLIKHRYLTARGKILMSETRLSRISHAMTSFEIVAGDKVVDFTVTVQAMFSLSLLLLKEIQLMENVTIMDQVFLLLNKIEEEADNVSSDTLLMESLIIRSKLDLVSGETKSAISRLDRANLIAEKTDNIRMQKLVNLEKTTLQNQMIGLQSLPTHEIVKRMNETDVIEYLEFLANESKYKHQFR